MIHMFQFSCMSLRKGEGGCAPPACNYNRGLSANQNRSVDWLPYIHLEVLALKEKRVQQKANFDA